MKELWRCPTVLSALPLLACCTCKYSDSSSDHGPSHLTGKTGPFHTKVLFRGRIPESMLRGMAARDQ